MTKSELIDAIAARGELTKARAEQVVNCVFDAMTEALQKGEGIEIRGFGSFTVRPYKPYSGRNPRTGEQVTVQAKRLPFFKVGKELKEIVDESRHIAKITGGSDDELRAIRAGMKGTVKEHLDVLARGAVDIVVIGELEKRLQAFERGERGPLRVKAGFDPTRPDLHFGHCVLLQKLRQIQDLGHTVVFLVGDYTAMVGDPSGKSDARPRLTHAEVMQAAATYQEQAFKVLDRGVTEVRFNGEWLAKLTAIEFIELAARVTVARLLERDDFSKRFAAHVPIYQHEFLYPLLQGYDSVALDADLELGGTDQLFNLNMGRDLMPRYGKPAQCVLTMPLLEGLDARLENGKIVGKKMSKSADNYIGIDEPGPVMFRKCMQIDDHVVWRYFELLSAKSSADIAELKAKTTDPREPKRIFGREMVTRFHGADEAARAESEFDRVYLDKGGVPDDVPEFTVTTATEGLWIAKALAEAKLVPSTSEGKRLVQMGNVELDGAKVTDERLQLAKGKRYLLRAGSKNRRFAYVVVA